MNLVFHISEDDSEINFVFMFSYYYSETAKDQCLKGPICMYSDSASLISFEIDCFYSSSTRTYQCETPHPLNYRPPTVCVFSIFNYFDIQVR